MVSFSKDFWFLIFLFIRKYLKGTGRWRRRQRMFLNDPAMRRRVW
jgi:hypothetical protein